MRHWLLALLGGLCYWGASGCTPPATPATSAVPGPTVATPATPQAATPAGLLAGYTSIMTVTPNPPVPGEPSNVTFQVLGPDGPEPVRDYEVVHEKKAHLLLLSRDMREYRHLHPEMDPDGTWRVSVTFPIPGPYRFFLDVTPKGQSQQVLRSDVSVPGEVPPSPPPLKVDRAPKTVTGAPPGPGLSSGLSADQPLSEGPEAVRVELETKPTALKAGPATLTYRLTAGNKPVKDLEHYLGALGHLVIVDTTQELFLHAHPMEHGIAAGPDVVFHTSFPAAGTYKMWAQFQRHGKIITVPFVVAVGPAEPTSASEPTPDGLTYTCPMHPEVSADRKGQCPRCHMELEVKAP